MADQYSDPAAVRGAVQGDKQALANQDIKAWCQRRWRYLFIQEAVKDDIALEIATQSGDRRTPRQRIAERFLHDSSSDWQDDQQPPWEGAITNTTLLFCPGMLNGMLPVRAFADNLPQIEKRFSMRVLRADSNPLASCEANVADIMKAVDQGAGLDAGGKLIEPDKTKPLGDIMLLGYSKGGPDILATLAAHPELAGRIRCAFYWSSPLLGSGAADDAISQIEKTPLLSNNAAAISKTMKGFVPQFLKQRAGAFRRSDEFDTLACTRDLTTAVREKFITDHGQTIGQMNVPMFSIGAATRLKDVPYIQRNVFKALCQRDKKNDMQVECGRACLPFDMANNLDIVRGHHWDIAYPAFVKRKWFNAMYHGFPKTAALVAMVQLSAELGLID